MSRVSGFCLLKNVSGFCLLNRFSFTNKNESFQFTNGSERFLFSNESEWFLFSNESLFVVSAVHFAPYLTSLSNMMLIYKQQELDVSEELTSTTGCRGRGLKRRLLSPWASTLPLSYPAIQR